jgi:hypothetical protein
VAGEFAQRIEIAVDRGQLPAIDARLAAIALLGALIEAAAGPLTRDTGHDHGAARELVQNVTLLVLRALGIVDARARGLVVQATSLTREGAA